MISMKSNLVKYIAVSGITAALAIAFASCGSDSKKDTEKTTSSSSLKYSDVSSDINKYCATSGCHSASSKEGSYDMSTQTGAAKKASLAASRIDLGTMPTSGSSEQKAFDSDSTAKSKLLEYFKAGAPE